MRKEEETEEQGWQRSMGDINPWCPVRDPRNWESPLPCYPWLAMPEPILLLFIHP